MFIQPMLASKPKEGLGVDSYSKNDWVMEEKFDGHRLIINVQNHEVTAWSRLGNLRVLPRHLIKKLKELPNVTVDGEAYVEGGTSTDVKADEFQNDLRIVLFDLLKVDAHTAMFEPMENRRALLTAAAQGVAGGAITIAEQFDPSEAALHELWSRGKEGAILKRRNALYEAGRRAKSWIKLKKEEPCITRVVGFEAGSLGPHAVLVLHAEEDGTKVTVKTLDNATRAEIAKNPKSFIGRRLLISYQVRTKTSFRHPMFDRWMEEGETLSDAR